MQLLMDETNISPVFGHAFRMTHPFACRDYAGIVHFICYCALGCDQRGAESLLVHTRTVLCGLLQQNNAETDPFIYRDYYILVTTRLKMHVSA